MLTLVYGFLIFQIWYQSIVVWASYGFDLIAPDKIAIIRDWFWILISGGIFLYSFPYWKKYFQHWKKLILTFSILLIFSVSLSFFFFQKGVTDILIGIKYGLRYRIIFMLAGGVGFFLSQKKEKTFQPTEIKKQYWLQTIIPYIVWGLVFTVIIGRIRQGAKLIFPDFFHRWGFGGLDDYRYGVNPPIYYLTGYQGNLRRQGLFSWPNNYGYFLIAFLPLIVQYFSAKISRKKEQRKSEFLFIFPVLLRLITLVFTLSRTAIIGLLVVGLLLLWKSSKKIRLTIFGIGILSVLGLSILKWESTLTHIEKKFGGLSQVLEKPLGYWLGSSGPAVHHSGAFLPENYYMQLMLDLGIGGFALRGILLWQLFSLYHTADKKARENWLEKSDAYLLFHTLSQGFLALLAMGIFLHIFEDSMVNYLFFILWGLALGQLQALADQIQVWRIDS